MAEQWSMLPERIHARVDELVRSLKATLGPELIGVVAYGSAVRGDFDPARSDVDLIIVVRDDAEARLEAMGPALALARSSARIEAMILRADEIPLAADVFPLLYDDIAHASRCIAGDNPFEGMTVPAEHRRLRIEQELREARIRMRRVATDMGAGPALAGAVERKLKQLRSPLHALVVAHGATEDDHLGPVLRAAGKLYDTDVAPLFEVREAPREAFVALARLIDLALADVDAALDVPSRARPATAAAGTGA